MFKDWTTNIVVCASIALMSLNGAYAQGEKKHFFAREFYKVTDTLFCGSEPTSKDKMTWLKSMGIKTIIDLRIFTGVKQEEAWAKEVGMDYYHISTGVLRPDEAKIKTVLAMVEDPKYQPVYVHCRTGCDRTGVIVGLFRVCKQGWTPKDAYNEMLSHHFRPVFFGMKRSFDDYITNPANTVAPNSNPGNTFPASTVPPSRPSNSQPDGNTAKTEQPTTSWIESADSRD